jgi:hypothetical protein
MTPLTIALRRLPDAARAEQRGILACRAGRAPEPPQDAYLAHIWWEGYVMDECRRMAEAQQRATVVPVVRCAQCGRVVVWSAPAVCVTCRDTAWQRAGVDMCCPWDHAVQVCRWCGGKVVLKDHDGEGIWHQECLSCTAGWDAPQWWYPSPQRT